MTDPARNADGGSARPPPFGQQVRLLRELMLLTQEALAEQAGISVGTIRGIERGRILRPRSATVRLLADALNLSGSDRRVFVLGARFGDSPSTLYQRVM